MKKPDEQTLAALEWRIHELLGLSSWEKPFTASLDAMDEAETRLIGSHDEGWRNCHHATKYGNELLLVQDQYDEHRNRPTGDYLTHRIMACDLQRITRLPAWMRAVALDRTLSESPIA